MDGGSAIHAGAGTFTLAGNVNVSPLGGTFHGANGAIDLTANLAGELAAGASFRLFDAPNYSGAFANLSLPPLNGNLIWQFTPTNGTLAVVSTVATTPTNIVAAVVGNTLELSWPPEHTGWTLEAQTNAPGTGLSEVWFAVPDSQLTNRVIITIDPATGSVFYRLRLP